MKRFLISICIILGVSISSTTYAQTFTMGKKCRALFDEANALLNEEAYAEALAKLDEFSGNCKTKDAKELGAVSKAEAYNNLGHYEKAISEADNALKITKDKSLAAYFQKGIALQNLGDVEGSKQALSNVIKLTEMNQNTGERANNYALMARIYGRQLNEEDSAMWYLDKAIALDPQQSDFLIQKGDLYLYYDQYEDAYAAYDQALANGHDRLVVYQSRTQVGLKKMENKYGTNKTQELRKQMTEEEKNMLCADIQKALDLGWRDMSMDMFSAMICQ
ncbi:hypothetical protein [Echinicola vietnamensis]|uniref:Uncharacterized protein n=1 Tax=Echinicola vietnamensis (strain DSM 17526 / LMG 23754 / KMM 6221) TaxID=926556 RepID=L0FZX0_ECHVK|nr:hypothetical protein [Echinicola vietnamensis]AGA79479.1 hypothetical protein Echvi_3253 [Echinicola vietnamensis DSM 17526]